MNTERTTPRIAVPLTIALLALAVRFVPAWVAPFTMAHFMGLGFGPLLGFLGLVVWWLFARRVSWRDRLLGTGAAVLVVVLALVVGHPSIVGVMIMRGLVIAIALTALGLVLTRSSPWTTRRWILAGALALGLLPWGAFRAIGQSGALEFELIPRWGKTAEDRFLEQRDTAPGATAAPAGAAGSFVGVAADWNGFRGPMRDGALHGVRFDTDWAATPPRELWRRQLGPAWSSFAVAGGLAFTQEQRGEDELVVAYALDDGREVWAVGNRERFEEPQGGPGPRATPAYDDGRVFAMGARGSVSAHDAATGERLWRRNVVDDVGAPIPDWGFSSSPLVVDRAVVVHAGGSDGRGLVAYDRDDGELLWSAGEGTLSYSSPAPATIGGVAQALIATEVGLEAFRVADGAPTWSVDWAVSGGARIVGPLVLGDGRTVIFPTGYGEGTRRLEVESAGDGFVVDEVWQSRFLKPYFNDAVCHEGHCYGFDNRIFTCIDASDGSRAWKGGRYGHGQVALLPEMDALLVISEDGEVVLLAADPAGHRELARLQALGGKTWNHPVVVGDRLLVRNDEEAACYELPGAAAVEARARR